MIRLKTPKLSNPRTSRYKVALDKIALKFMDGKNNRNQIIDSLVKEVEKGTLTVSKENVKVEDPKEIKKEISTHLNNTIDRLSLFGVFE